MSFSYRSLTLEDLPLMKKWLNQSYVKKWYSKQTWTLEQLKNKYIPYINHDNDIYGFITELDGKPIGYIQYYPVEKYQWQDHGLDENLEACAGIDTFIGEKSYLGKGLSHLMIARFLKSKVFKLFSKAVVDPHFDNKLAIHCYQKCGFKPHKPIKGADGDPYLLMVCS